MTCLMSLSTASCSSLYLCSIDSKYIVEFENHKVKFVSALMHFDSYFGVVSVFIVILNVGHVYS